MINGPILTRLKISARFVQLYQSGVITHSQCEAEVGNKWLTVALTGYTRTGVNNSGPFWQLRGSFGKQWGMDGLFRVEKWNDNSNMHGPCWIHWDSIRLVAKKY